MSDVWIEFLAKQAPLVGVLIGGIMWLSRYFTKLQDQREQYFKTVIEQRDKIIEGKDKIIAEQNERVISIINQQSQSLSKFELTFQNMTKTMDELRNEIKK